MNEIMYFTEASMEDSFVYKVFSDSNNILSRLLSAIKDSTVLDKSFFEEQYLQLKKGRSSSPFSNAVCEAFDSGKIEILYSDTTKIPLSIPFIIRRGTHGPVASIFISSFTSIDDSQSLTIPFKTLYILMESAYIALCIQSYQDKLTRSVPLMKITKDIYVSMVMRILNRDFAITSDKMLENKVTFSIAKFYLQKIWGLTNEETINNYAAYSCNNINEIDMNDIIYAYNEANINDINDLLLFIKTISPRMANLNIKFFMERWINTYGQSAILSLDYLPYLFFVIINTLLGGFIVSQTALSDMVKSTQNINQFYRELSKLY